MWTRAVVVAAASVHDHAIGSAPLDKVAAAARASAAPSRLLRDVLMADSPRSAWGGCRAVVEADGCHPLPGRRVLSCSFMIRKAPRPWKSLVSLGRAM